MDFKHALTLESPLTIVGVPSAYSVLLAEQAGFKALYLSGAGVANVAFGIPDLGLITFTELAVELAKITQLTALPVLVDIDNGFGGPFQVARATKVLVQAGAAALQLEDQTQNKRCGHRDGKTCISNALMCDKIKALKDAAPHVYLIARTDAQGIETPAAVQERVQAYVAAGADAIFVEAVQTLEQVKDWTKSLKVPLLVNLTEFGKTPLWSHAEMAEAGVGMLLYPLGAMRMMHAAAQTFYYTLRQEKTQKSLLSKMQTREQLYTVLNYEAWESRQNQIRERAEDE